MFLYPICTSIPYSSTKQRITYFLIWNELQICQVTFSLRTGSGINFGIFVTVQLFFCLLYLSFRLKRL
jgi:hypothetical protein